MLPTIPKAPSPADAARAADTQVRPWAMAKAPTGARQAWPHMRGVTVPASLAGVAAPAPRIPSLADQMPVANAAADGPPEEAEASTTKSTMDAMSGVGGDVSDNISDNEQLGQWFSWQYWSMLAYCAGTLLFFSEVLCPLLGRFVGDSLLLEAAMFFLQMVAFMLVAAWVYEPKAAGASHARALGTIMACLSFLMLLGAISLRFGNVDKSTQHLALDVSHVFRPLSRLIVLFLIVHGVLESSQSDWGNLVLMGSFLALGLAFALSGFAKDVFAYFLIRSQDYFEEEDFVFFQGELYQVKHIRWMHTKALRVKTRSSTFIPNSVLVGQKGLCNQSKDNSKCVEADIPLPYSTSGAKLETIVRECWDLLKGVEESGFVALNGQDFECQFDVPKSAIYICEIEQSPGGGEFANIKLHMRLFGKYYFSNPPPWKKQEPEPPLEARQMDWKMPWHYQVEWFLIESKKIIERNAKM